MEPAPTRSEVWEAVQPLAARYRLAPEFVFALVAAESNFDPRARNGAARGLLQVQPAAWAAVATRPYAPNVWHWRQNLAVGVDYLAFIRSELHRRGKFSYPLLLACFHYGLEYVERRDFDLRALRVPENEIYRQLWAGNLAPVAPPQPGEK